MSKKRFVFRCILIFIIAQIAWFSLLGLWIYRYISSHIILSKVDDSLSAQIMSKGANIFTLVFGFVLFIAISMGMFLIFRNLTVQYKLTRLYDNFLANVTHELKTPLASIQLHLETLNGRNVPPSKQKKFIGMMLKDTNRLNRLIDSILEIAGLEQKNALYQCRVFNADAVIKGLVEEARIQFSLPEDAVHIEGNADCECVINKNAFKILIDNLIDNAVKYTKNHLKICVVLKCTGKKLIFEFADNGIGIAPKNLKKIFKKFYRISRPDVPNVKGTGLGLYWTKEIVKYHGGGIKAVSQENGTIFRVELPVYNISKKHYLNRLLESKKKMKF
jgi:signal transduction histidine kinase